MSFLRVLPGGDQPRPRSGSATSVRVEAPGKVNLFLSAGAPSADGYHPLTTVFQAVRLVETVTARRQSADDHGRVTLSLVDPDPAVPTDERNLAVRAAQALAQATGVSEGVDLLLRKRVPAAGGMAGGSADAAATLVACNQLWGTGLNLPELTGIARQLGADCAFPLLGSTAVGQGRGDELSPLMTRGTFHWVFALAHEGLSTPAVFTHLDQLRGWSRPAHGATGADDGAPALPAQVPGALSAALRAGDAVALAPCLHNDLQEAAIDLRPELGQVVDLAERSGALRAIVSGSGPTIAALVPDVVTGARVARVLAASELVSATVRADAPVAGARVVG